MAERWTMKQLESYGDVEFAVAILRERESKLNPYAPLAERINKSVKALNNRQLYVLYTCDEWKSTGSMALRGVFTEQGLRESILKGIDDKVFDYDGARQDILSFTVEELKVEVDYGFIEPVTIDETI